MNKSILPWKRNKNEGVMRPLDDNPFMALHQQMNNLFEDFFGDFEGALRSPAQGFLSRGAFGQVPSVDVAETDDEVTVTADLPGLTEKDVEVTLDDDVVTIKGHRSEQREDKQRNYHVMERSYGEFQRAVALPAGIDRDKVKAEFKNGVLKLTMPKQPEAKAHRRKIEIKAA